MAEREDFQFESEEIDLKSILYKYLRYWYLFVLGVIVCLTLAFLYLRYTTPKYNITSTLLIKDDKKSPDLGGAEAMFGDLGMFQGGNNIENEIQVLSSKSLMQRVLEELSLKTSYFVEGRIKSTEAYGRSLPVRVIVNNLDSAAFDKSVTLHIKDNNSFNLEDDEEHNYETTSHKFGQEIKKPYAVFTVVSAPGIALEEGKEIVVNFHDLRKLANAYNQKLIVAPVNKEASVLNISLTDAVPEKGKDIINKLIEVYNKEAVEDKNQIAANTIEFIDERLEYLTSELTNVEKNVEEYKQENKLTDVSTEAQLYIERASEYNKQLAEFEIQIDVLNSIENYLSKQGGQFELVPSTLSIQDPTLLGLIGKFNELQLERQRMLRTTQESNPLVQNINEQLTNLRANILENLRNIRRGLTITRDNLQASSSKFETRIQKVPAIERELLEINRQQGIKQELYLYLLQKREESALSLAATVSNSRVIDPAMSGDEPVEPKKQLILLLALLLGLGIPFAGIYVKEMLNDKVQELKDVTAATNTPVLGEIAHNDTGETLVVTERSRSSVAELFRLIRTNLQFATVGKANKVILVTSSMSGEGKTFFGINLAASLVLTGKKAVVLGFDLRKPRLTQDLGVLNDIGISNFLVSDRVSVDSILTEIPSIPGLCIIGSGPIPPNPAELMTHLRIEELINDLRTRFDYIIIDSAPVGQVADAFALESYIDSSIYIVRYNYTFKEQLKIVDDIYRNKKLRYPMVVLNGSKKHSGYGYGYGKGYGYNDDSQQSSIRKIRDKVFG